MEGKSQQETNSCPAPTRVRTVAEEDTWRARQLLASKRSSTGSTPARDHGNATMGRNRRLASIGSDMDDDSPSSTRKRQLREESADWAWSAPNREGVEQRSWNGGYDHGLDVPSGSFKDDALDYEVFASAASVTATATTHDGDSSGRPVSGGAGGRRESDGPRSRGSELPRVDAGTKGDTVKGLDEEVEAFAATLRKQFESEVLVTAKERLRAASLRATKDGHLRLEAHRRESARDTRRLEDEAAHLREEISRLQGVNAGLTDQVEVLGERLSAVQLRFAKASTVARCFHAWRLNAAEVRKARSKNELAVDHARRVVIIRVFSAWRRESRRRHNSRGLKAADMRLEAITKEIVGRYEAELSGMRAALDEANRQISVEKARQREIEEGMKRTLRRGMSAMSMEAMQLLNEARGVDGSMLRSVAPPGGGVVDSRTASVSDSLRGYPQSRTGSFIGRPSSGQRIPEECPLPLAPPRPSSPSLR